MEVGTPELCRAVPWGTPPDPWVAVRVALLGRWVRLSSRFHSREPALCTRCSGRAVPGRVPLWKGTG